MSTSSRRLGIMAQRDVHRDSYIEEWPEAGLIMINSPADPVPSIDLDEHQQIIALDGRLVAEFDMMDHFIKDNGIDTSIAEEAMTIDSEAYAHMLVDINVTRQEIAGFIITAHTLFYRYFNHKSNQHEDLKNIAFQCSLF